MIVFQVQKVSKSFADKEVLREVSLAVQEKERVGLVGVNGSGKTTLLRCLTGELQPDAGEVILSSSLSLGCLEQMTDKRPGITAWDAVMESFTDLIEKRQLMQELERKMGEGGSVLPKVMEQYARVSEEYERANGYACENTARRILTGLGFGNEEFQKPLAAFSGGQKTRLNMGRLLALAPDVLLLDEPTNHMDMDSVEWLEDFIKTYAGTVLVVSHDRMFLDRVATRIAELRLGELKSYPGNYSAYVKKKAEDELAEQRAYQKQQVYIHQTEDYIRRFKAGIKSKQARGRQSQLERVVRIDAPQREHSVGKHVIKINRESGNDVLTVDGVAKSYQGRAVLKDVQVRLKKGDKLALIGPNGAGKTTLLKIISGQIPADQGEIRLGSQVEMAYFSQEYEDLNLNRTVLEEILFHYDLTLEEARTMLGGMLFSEDDVFKQVGDLSGGEMGRLAFLKMILSGANFLLLDEPTNHLDIDSCQVVEKMLADFDGTVLVVSHDRYFIDQVADRILAIEDGQTEYYWGNYSYYQEKKQEKAKILQIEKREMKEKASRPDLQLREEEKERKKVRRRLDKDLALLEASIMETERRKTELESFLADPATYNDEGKARDYTSEYRQVEQMLEAAYGRWESLNHELESLDRVESQGC
ncbi:MAG: ABC-F family ATP-binding cassette domain-containing protein [Syntrophomonas sp.]|nr:ABC-F family ATP-binding cassette domain-containing protein [Syntrophomonas sp.]